MRRLVLACTALAVLVACSGQPSPIEPSAGFSGAASGSSATVPSPSVTPPALPKVAERRDDEGMASFVGFWIYTLNFSVDARNPGPLQEISLRSCEGCASYIRQIRSDRESHIRSEGFKWVPQSATFDGLHSVRVSVDAAEFRRIKAGGDRETVRASNYEIGFDLKWTDGSWHVEELYLP
jgi:hypothetical protein